MARGVGDLLVTLGLDFSDYTRGLTKAERDAQIFASRINATILQVGKIIGGLELGSQFLSATKDIISSASALQDLSAVTGSSVESLSKLSNQAQISGASFDTLKTLMGKFTAALGGGGKEAEKVGKALEFLGVSATDPANAIQDIAKKLNQFADGAGKAAIARELFGKGGEQFLSVLKDIANAQDVAATVTAKQAEEAQKLEQALRRLSAEATTFRNAVLSDIVPALNNAIEQFIEGTKVAGGFWSALLLFGTQNPFKDVGPAIADVRKDIELLQEASQKSGLFGTKDTFGAGGDPAIARLQKRLEFLKLLQRQQANALISPSNDDARDIRSRIKPPLDFKGTPDSKAMKERISEAQRYIESLEKQLEKTQELTVAEQLWLDFSLGRIKDMTAAQFASANAIAVQIDANHALTKEIEAGAKAFEEEARAAKKAADEQAHATKSAQDSADQVLKSNEALRDEIAIILGGDAARKALEKDYVNRAIAVKEALAAELALTKGTELQVDAINIEIEALKERAELLKGRDFAEALAAEAKNLQDVKNAMSDALVQPLADFVTGTKSAKDAFKSFVADVTQQLARLASQNVANALFGGKNSNGPDFFAVMTKFLGLFGGGTGGFEGSAGFGAGEGFALGGVSRGGIATVGEHGAEEVFLPKGARVISHAEVQNRRQAKAVTNIFNVNVMPGANTQSVMQTKAMLRDAVMQSARER